MATIGDVSITPMEKSHHVEWKILNFTSSLNENEKYFSPSFSFAGECWNLMIYTNGYKAASSAGYISIYLERKSSAPSSAVLEYSLGLKPLNGENILTWYSNTFNNINQAWGIRKFFFRSDLLKRDDIFSLTDSLTVFCFMKCPKAAVNAIGNIASAKCSHCKETFDAESLSTHKKKCVDKPIKCSRCSSVVILQNWFRHSCQIENAKDHRSLSQDYKKMLLGGRNHDLILKVGDQELRAHQDILRARSRVFESMLDHNMKEKNSGVIDIPDCKPQVMEQFLSYVYCGKVETLDQSNMLELYYVADKYEMMGLKIKCTNFIKYSLSPTNICNVIQLALNHSDSDLLDHATNYFIDNVLDIMHTVEWQSFMKDNSTVANELLIKAFKKN